MSIILRAFFKRTDLFYFAIMLRHSVFRSKWLTLAWFLLMNLLFFLPGSAFPSENILSKIYFDKIVHMGLFGVLAFTWRSSFEWRKNYIYVILICCLLYGLMVEIVQRNWVPNRDFDLYDVVADVCGAAIGLLVWREVYKKK